ncbi:MAG: MFS transporter [Bacteroidales bacterium]|nr:MAG: MFS transporter [Bacteroidales bacterium]
MGTYNKKLIFTAACLGMLMFGIVMAVLGAVLPSVIEKFQIDMADAGSLFFMMSMGMLFGSMVFGPVVDRYGYKGLLIICAILIFASIEGIAFAWSMTILRISLLIVGFTGGAINGGTNALVSDISEKNRGSGLSFLGVFFGIGAFGIPFLLGILLDHFSYETLIAIVGSLILLPLVFFILLKFPAPKHEQGFPLREGIGLTRETTLLLFGLMLFIQSGMEMTVGGWSATFLNKELNIEASKSVLILSLFWMGLILARLSLGKILNHIAKSKVLLSSLFIAIAGSLFMLLSNRSIMALSGLIITGIGFAAVFPLVLAFVGDLYSKLSGTAFSLVLAIALLGGMLFPYLVGIMANSMGLRLSLALVPFSMFCSALIFRLILFRFKKQTKMQ